MNRTARKDKRTGRGRTGFSLTELLIVITIIALLGGISIGILNAAQNAACKRSTQGTIAKLHEVIMQRYESYQGRRVELLDNNNNQLSPIGMQPTHWAQARLDAIRDLIRMEMPDRWNDISDGPIGTPNPEDLNSPVNAFSFEWGKINAPPLHATYQNESIAAYQRAAGRGIDNIDSAIAKHGSAECLYMLIMHGSPESRRLFKDSEVGDTDGDGLPEFIDGWGNPIYWIRWAPGYTNTSPIQHDDADAYHDSFDPRHVDGGAYRLIPLIYSAGPDGIYDLKTGLAGEGDENENEENPPPGYHFDGSPYSVDLGRPYDGNNNGRNDHVDNITNHDIS